MTILSMISMRSASEAQADKSLKSVALLSCIGLVVSLCLMTLGVDLGASSL
jgi:hypothetical protein